MAGEDGDLGQPASSRVTDRDLLWVESVSERLLGHSAPRAWEKAFFQPEPEAPRADEALHVTQDGDDAPSFSVPTGRPDSSVFGDVLRPSYFTEGDADWRHDLGPEFPDDPDVDDDLDDLEGPPEEPRPDDVVIDLTEPARPQPPTPPAAPGRIDDEIMRLALGSGDTVLAGAVLLLLEDRARDRQRISTLETALRALVEQVDRIDGPDHDLAVTARLLRRVVES